jgi:tungstate transport system ATP-binding protein
MNALLDVRDLQVWRDGRQVLMINHLEVERGEVLAVIGPNGAGKTTLLLSIARLLKPEHGTIRFDGEELESLEVLSYRRRIALVLQEPLLLDASVFDNVALGLRFRRLRRLEVNHRVDEWLSRMEVAHLRERRASQLSGGEAQRVSLARAFAIQPELLMLDEPFGALDAPTRNRLLDDLSSVLADTKVTTVFITHHLEEALRLGQRVAVVLEGRLRQWGTPQEVFSNPVDEQVAQFVEADNGRKVSPI